MFRRSYPRNTISSLIVGTSITSTSIFSLCSSAYRTSRERMGPTHALSAPDSRELLTWGLTAHCGRTTQTADLLLKSSRSMPSLTLCAGPAGTKLMSHTSLCLHKAGAPRPGRIRDIVLFRFQHAERMDLTWNSAKQPPAA